MLKPAAFMPSNAASKASIAMGFLMAPLMLQRGPMGARFKAPQMNDTVPAELAGLPPRVQRALGFVPLAADSPSACGGCARLRATLLTPPASDCRQRTSPRVRDGEARRHLLPRISPEPKTQHAARWPPACTAASAAAPWCKQSAPKLIAAPPRCWSPCPQAQPLARARRAGAPPPKAPPPPRCRLCPPPLTRPP